MAGNRRSILSRGKIHCDRQVGLRLDREIQLVRNCKCSVWDDDGRLSTAERHGLQG